MYTVETKQAGLWYIIWEGDRKIAQLMQGLIGGKRPNGRWIYEIFDSTGEHVRTSSKGTFSTSRKAWDACQKKL